ncbi:hypothetical protein V2I52_04355 [Brenneria sp. g21c3]|uniref:hypothetical protein n=1 Tax=Brenneria sp. g21c3 TaxID=3093893 RepID=UPI002EAA1CA9|nr:hypothetical protein [Brenneria sp. g21c3]
MKWIELIVGSTFQDLIAHGKEIDTAIRKGGYTLTKRSTREMEDYFDKPLYEQAIPHPFAAGGVYVILLIAFSVNMIFTLYPFHLAPAAFISMYFGAMSIFLIILLSAARFISRGRVRGLVVFNYLFIIVFFMLIATSGYTVFVEGLHDTKKLIFFIGDFVVLWCCRWLMNSRAFFIFALYCRTKRLAHVSKQVRMRKISR